MVSAPPGGARQAPRRRSTGNTSTRRSTPRRSAPARVSVTYRGRRALSAPPGVRRWTGPYRPATPRPTRKMRPSARRSLAAGLLGLLALSGGAGGPHVGTSGKALAVWPLGSSGPTPRGAATTYRYGSLPRTLAVEVPMRRRAPNPHRKMFPGGHALSGMYEPKLISRPAMHRKMLPGKGGPLPVPTITAGDVRFLENKGFVFPKKVHAQAERGHAIIGDANIPNWASDPQYRRTVAALLSTHKPPQNKYSVPHQLALPAPVQRKLKTLENRVKAAAAEGTARVVTFPYKTAAKARAATGYIFSLPGRAFKSLKAVHNVARRRTARAVA